MCQVRRGPDTERSWGSLVGREIRRDQIAAITDQEAEGKEWKGRNKMQRLEMNQGREPCELVPRSWRGAPQRLQQAPRDESLAPPQEFARVRAKEKLRGCGGRA
jgi:hypothetical protein